MYELNTIYTLKYHPNGVDHYVMLYECEDGKWLILLDVDSEIAIGIYLHVKRP